MSENGTNGALLNAGYKWAANFGVAVVFCAFLGFIVYKIIFGAASDLVTKVESLSAKESDLQTGQQQIIKEHAELRQELLDEARKQTKIQQGTCLGVNRTLEAQQKYCIP